MRDIDLYQRIFGLEKPWFVKRADMQVAQNRVDIWLEHFGGAKDAHSSKKPFFRGIPKRLTWRRRWWGRSYPTAP